jgi:hypothetical protein
MVAINDESLRRANKGLQQIELSEAGASSIILVISQPHTSKIRCHHCGADLGTEKKDPQQMSIEVDDRPVCEPCRTARLWQELMGTLFDSSVFLEVIERYIEERR